MNIAMKDSNGELLEIPIQSNNSCKKMQLGNEVEINFIDLKQAKTSDCDMIIDSYTDQENSEQKVHEFNQVFFLETLNLDSSQNIEDSVIVEEYQFSYNDSTNEIQKYLKSDNHEKIVKCDVSALSLCRLCAEQSENMFYIFGLSKEEKDIAEKINKCLPITVQKLDTFPKMICLSCHKKVEFLHDFCKTVSEAEAKFINRKSNYITNKITEEKKSYQQTLVVSKSINKNNEVKIIKDNFKVQPEQNSSKNFQLSRYTKEEIRCRICSNKFDSTRKCYLHATHHSSSNFYPCGLCEKVLKTSKNWREHYTEHTIGDKICKRRSATYECKICNKKYISESRLNFHLKFHEPGVKHCYCEKCDKFLATESTLYHHSVMVHLQFREFCCDICGNTFRSQVQLDTHQRKHKNERPYECDICYKRFYSTDSLRRHQKLHLPDKPIQCNQCSKRFNRTNSLNKHLLTHQVETKQSMICQICNACNQVFFDISESKSHLETCNTIVDLPQIQNKSLNVVYRCEFCQRCFTSIESTIIHRNSHTGPLPYICTICDVTYATYNQVQAHKSAHRKSVQDLQFKKAENITKLFFCQFCDKEFLHFTNMNLHRNKTCLKTKHWTCRYCATSFQSRQELSKHKNRQEPGENWPCGNCKMTFGNLCGLDKHKEIHTEQYTKRKLFTCNYCEKEFPQKAHLTIHIRSHTGEKPFSCDLCNKAFSIKTDRNNHRRTHTGERPFKCKLCVKDFTNPARLREHMLHHSDNRPYKCSLCDRAFKKSNARIVHMRIHTGERPFQCDICGNNFRRSGDMNKHKKSQHNTNVSFTSEVKPTT